jgi:hypothetical protein
MPIGSEEEPLKASHAMFVENFFKLMELSPLVFSPDEDNGILKKWLLGCTR